MRGISKPRNLGTVSRSNLPVIFRVHPLTDPRHPVHRAVSDEDRTHTVEPLVPAAIRPHSRLFPAFSCIFCFVCFCLFVLFCKVSLIDRSSPVFVRNIFSYCGFSRDSAIVHDCSSCLFSTSGYRVAFVSSTSRYGFVGCVWKWEHFRRGKWVFRSKRWQQCLFWRWRWQRFLTRW